MKKRLKKKLGKKLISISNSYFPSNNKTCGKSKILHYTLNYLMNNRSKKEQENSKVSVFLDEFAFLDKDKDSNKIIMPCGFAGMGFNTKQHSIMKQLIQNQKTLKNLTIDNIHTPISSNIEKIVTSKVKDIRNLVNCK